MKICKKKTIQYVEERSNNSSETESEDGTHKEKLYFTTKKVAESKVNQDFFKINVLIDGKKFEMDIDTGASVSIINSQHYDQYFINFELYKSNIKLCTFAGNN